MNNIDFNAIIKDVLDQVLTLAQKIVKEYVTQADNDVKEFLDDTKQQLTEWAEALALGQLSEEEFASLSRGQIDLAEMHGLKQAGLAEARLDEFKDGVIDILTSVVVGAIKNAI